MRSPSPRSTHSVEVLLLRHAPTRWNDEGRRLGWEDQPLTPAGRHASAEWARRTRPEVDVVCSSDLARARETAGAIASTLALGEVRELEGLREQHQGAWTGLTKEQIKLRWPERWRERPRHPLDGETEQAVLGRVLAVLAGLAVAHAGESVLAVTHSQVIRMLERTVAVPAPRVPHLQGRWVSVAASAGGRGEASIEAIGAGALTDGRAPAPAASGGPR